MNLALTINNAFRPKVIMNLLKGQVRSADWGKMTESLKQAVNVIRKAPKADSYVKTATIGAGLVAATSGAANAAEKTYQTVNYAAGTTPDNSSATEEAIQGIGSLGTMIGGIITVLSGSPKAALATAGVMLTNLGFRNIKETARAENVENWNLLKQQLVLIDEYDPTKVGFEGGTMHTARVSKFFKPYIEWVEKLERMNPLFKESRVAKRETLSESFKNQRELANGNYKSLTEHSFVA